MSVSDVFITDLEASDLKPANLEGMLHHPFQEKRSLPGSNRMEIRSIAFDSPAFGQRNEVQIPAIDLIPHEMFLEITVSAAANNDANTQCYLMPTPTWLSQQGADLNYKETSIYNMSEAECLMNCILDHRENVFQGRQRLMGFTQSANNANASQKLYLPLDPLCTQVLSKVGPLSAYASNDWSVSVDLRASNYLIRNSQANATPQTMTISSMNLVLIGSLAPVGEVALARDALSKNGIVWNFLRSYYVRNTLSDNQDTATTYQLTYNSIVGAVNQVRLLIRDSTTWNTTNAQIVDSVSYKTFYGVSDTINCGKTSNPYEVWGQNLSLPVVYSLFSSRGTLGNTRFVKLPSSGNCTIVDTGIINIEFGESPTDYEYGTSTGSYPVKNNLEVDLNIATDTQVDCYADSVILVHVRGVISSGTANINLSA